MASISVLDLGDRRYKIRWRELMPGAGGLPERGTDGRLRRRNRSMVVEGRAARDEMVARIRRAIQDDGEFQPATAALPPPTPANLEQAALAWLEWKKTRCRASTVVCYATHLKAFFGRVREVLEMAEGDPISAPALSRSLVVDCMRYWQGLGRSEAWVYGACRSVLDMWRWVSDDPERFIAVPIPPRESKMVLPRLPVYSAPPAPTLAEVDACLRWLPLDAEESRRLGVLMRFTGLRIAQALAVHREYIDLRFRALTVQFGKSRIEDAQARTVPISEFLAAEIERWTVGRPESGPLFPVWGQALAEETAAPRNPIFHAAWAAATEAGETRRSVWDPPNRKIARPQQAFRAAFQAFLRSRGIGDEVIDALVGHAGRSVRERHYAGPDTLWDRMVEAVALIPAVDWIGPGQRASGKVVEMGRRG